MQKDPEIQQLQESEAGNILYRFESSEGMIVQASSSLIKVIPGSGKQLEEGGTGFLYCDERGTERHASLHGPTAAEPPRLILKPDWLERDGSPINIYLTHDSYQDLLGFIGIEAS